MDLALTILILVVIVALIFDLINGFHDTANAVATVVCTGVLSLRSAILIAAALNFFGALLGTAVAATIGKGLVEASAVTSVVVLFALLGAIFWNLLTWYYGIPSSSSHALIGGLIGATVVSAGWSAIQLGGVMKVLKALVLSPVIGGSIGLVLMIALFWICQRRNQVKVAAAFRKLQLVSASFMAFSHGSNDAQKTMGIITMALIAAGYGAVGDFHVPMWVVISSALAMAIGTAMGGVKIIKTMGSKLIELKPPEGFAAETAAAATILSASAMGLPVSTTHVISGSIMGVGASKGLSQVRWGKATKILWAWVLTIPASAFVSGLLYVLFAWMLQ
jgi:PiT family inorganic phosphate transporter